MVSFAANGGQLRKLKAQLANPMCQDIGIVFIGDSITWGSGASESGGGVGRDGTLSDPRANYASPNFVNLFKRYVRDTYVNKANLVEAISNWPSSSVGDAVAAYSSSELMFPCDGFFTNAKIGASQEPATLTHAASPSGSILSLNNTVDAAQYGHSVSFAFTGSSFMLSLRVSGATNAFYDVLINGVLFATVNAQPGFNGLIDDVANLDQRITTTFPFVKNATITIRTNRNGLTGQRLLSITAIRFDRAVRITNNGIVGRTSVSYLDTCINGAALGDGVAISPSDQFVICQIGTNDRAIVGGRPMGSNQFKQNLENLLDAIPESKEIILMCANPAANEDPAIYSFSMNEVRNVISTLARQRSIDFVDNYAIFSGMNSADFTLDGLHPNDAGHSMIAVNLISAFEHA